MLYLLYPRISPSVSAQLISIVLHTSAARSPKATADRRTRHSHEPARSCRTQPKPTLQNRQTWTGVSHLAPLLDLLLLSTPEEIIHPLSSCAFALPLHTLFVAILQFYLVLPLPGSPGQRIVLLVGSHQGEHILSAPVTLRVLSQEPWLAVEGKVTLLLNSSARRSARYRHCSLQRRRATQQEYSARIRPCPQPRSVPRSLRLDHLEGSRSARPRRCLADLCGISWVRHHADSWPLLSHIDTATIYTLRTKVSPRVVTTVRVGKNG